MAVQYLKPSLSKDCWKEGCSEQQNKNFPRIVTASPIFPGTLLKTSRLLTAIVLVTASRQGCYLLLIACCPGEGRAGRTLRSSSGPTSLAFNLVYGRPYRAHRLRALLLPLLLSVLFFPRGGLGVGEKHTRGELVRSTHRVPSPFISPQRFPFETFRVSQHSMGLATAYGPFLPAVYHPFVLREAR